MSKPDIKIDIEPFESGKVQYLPLGATSTNGTPGVEIVIRLNLQNIGSTLTTATGITFSFPSSTQPTFVMQNIDHYGVLTLAPNQNQIWTNGIVSDKINNSVYLTGVAPPQIRIDVICTGFSSPASVTYPLAPHESPVAGGAYRFPFAAGDLRGNEYLQASAVHTTGNGGKYGTQICAHDVLSVGWDESIKAWTDLVPGGDAKKNDGHRIWNKPVCAMADGTVVDWLDTMEDNTVLEKMPDPVPNPVFGNNILVKHGTEVVRYCHFRKGSMTPSLMQKGAVVLEGQHLGSAGNSGNSSGPHTHIEVERASDFALRPFPFRDAWIIGPKLLSPLPSASPWYDSISKEFRRNGSPSGQQALTLVIQFQLLGSLSVAIGPIILLLVRTVCHSQRQYKISLITRAAV
jgi:Peptidase family M23